MLIYIFERDGDASNIWPTCFGSVGKESSFVPFNYDRSGCVREVTSSNDNLPRNMWQIAREEAYCDPDGYVRKEKLTVGDATLDDKGRGVKHISYLERPVQKLVLLVPSDENRKVPTEKP